ncbi:DnaJ C-terminal domain-containing protein [Streptomyces sp. RTGN2]|uniref:DnaJ C-terminal domain-containing protein n=1 Tax=Streptomyces sp. RTGN2 TaxID=3016525 RepID=UPI0025533CE9|nr:DnaJ C-terminal domain-containing protein [Streptomyces sp. RTGN2]
MRCLGALFVGSVILVWGLATFFGGPVECGDGGVIHGDSCVTPTRAVTQDDMDDARHLRHVLGGVGIAVGPLLFLGVCGFALRESRARRPARARVSLTPEQAEGGGTVPVDYRVRARCPHCDGRGVRTVGAGRRCARCRGTGLSRRGPRSVTVRIPVGVRHGSTLRIRGRGTPGKGGAPSGDLLLTVLIAGPPARPGTSAAPPRQRTGSAPPRPGTAAAPPGGPATIEAGGIRITAGPDSVTVREERRSPGGRITWVTTHELRWPDIALLVFDSDRHDPVVALYAIPADAAAAGRGRHHLADDRRFTAADWDTLAAGIARHSHGRVRLDLASRNAPGGLRDG